MANCLGVQWLTLLFSSISMLPTGFTWQFDMSTRLRRQAMSNHHVAVDHDQTQG